MFKNYSFVSGLCIYTCVYEYTTIHGKFETPEIENKGK